MFSLVLPLSVATACCGCAPTCLMLPQHLHAIARRAIAASWGPLGGGSRGGWRRGGASAMAAIASCARSAVAAAAAGNRGGASALAASRFARWAVAPAAAGAEAPRQPLRAYAGTAGRGHFCCGWRRSGIVQPLWHRQARCIGGSRGGWASASGMAACTSAPSAPRVHLRRCC